MDSNKKFHPSFLLLFCLLLHSSIVSLAHHDHDCFGRVVGGGFGAGDWIGSRETFGGAESHGDKIGAKVKIVSQEGGLVAGRCAVGGIRGRKSSGFGSCGETTKESDRGREYWAGGGARGRVEVSGGLGKGRGRVIAEGMRLDDGFELIGDNSSVNLGGNGNNTSGGYTNGGGGNNTGGSYTNGGGGDNTGGVFTNNGGGNNTGDGYANGGSGGDAEKKLGYDSDNNEVEIRSVGSGGKRGGSGGSNDHGPGGGSGGDKGGGSGGGGDKDGGFGNKVGDPDQNINDNSIGYSNNNNSDVRGSSGGYYEKNRG